MTINYETSLRGTVEHDGATVTLTDDAQPTGRLMPDAARASGWCEWVAHGTTESGLPARVYWEHQDDGETLPEDYDWGNVERIEIEATE